MKKIVDIKTGRKVVVFNEYKLNGSQVCPECGRPFKDYDVKRLEANGRTRCTKCGARLVK